MAALSITALASFFIEENKSILRGENHYKSDHIEQFSFDQGVLRGSVHASMKKKVYKVEVYLGPDNETIKSTTCECPRGEYKCSHAAAVYIYGIYNLSRTDVECQWKKKKSKHESVKSIAEMYPSNKPDYVALTRKPTAADRTRLYQNLKSYGKFTGLCWILSPEPKPQIQSLPIPTLEEIIFSEDFLSVQGIDNQRTFIIDKLSLTEELITSISNLTIGQRDNPLWHMARKGRLTASNFGHVLNAKRATPSLIKRLLGEYDISRVKAVQWGVVNEDEGVKAFQEQTGIQVQQTGLWLEKSGVLGASPDGIMGKNHVLEVKCPYTFRNNTIDEAINSSSDFFLKKDENGKVQLRDDHVYWHQVQGQLHITRRTICYFVVWTTKDCVSLTIKRDPAWEHNINLLQDFYFVHIFPRIVEGEL